MASPPTLRPHHLIALEHQLLSITTPKALADFDTTLVNLLRQHLDEGSPLVVASLLRLRAHVALKQDHVDTASPHLLLALRGFTLLGIEDAFHTTQRELVLALATQHPAYPHQLALFDDVREHLHALQTRWVTLRKRTTHTSPSLEDYLERVWGQLEGKALTAPWADDEQRLALLVARLTTGLNEGRMVAPIQRLMQRLQLKPLEVWVLLALHTCHTDPFIRDRFAETWDPSRQREPDVNFLCGLLLGPPSPAWRFVQSALSASSPLREFQLLNVGRSELGVDLVRLTTSGLQALDGVRGLAAGLSAWCQPLTANPDVVANDPGEEPLSKLIRAWSNQRLHDPSAQQLRILLRGTTVAERRRQIAIACAHADLDVVAADLGLLAQRPHEELLAALGQLAREVSLHDQLALLDVPPLPRDEQHQQRQRATLLPALQQGLKRFNGPVILSLPGDAEGQVPALPGAIDLEVSLLSVERQLEVWRQALERNGLVVPGPEQLLALCQRYPLGAEAIEDAAHELRVKATLLNEVTSPDSLVNAAGRKAQHAMDGIAQRLPISLTWNDVVLPRETMSQLKEVVAFAQHRHRVLDDWGFRAKLPYGRALSALFWGPPGTGKTMMAGIIARELGMELFRVDLSQVVSKYIGETEKNLGRAFDEANRNNAILLFDEADSLFSKRTEVKSSNDRYANLEVNFLLQRMEAFEGVTILTTNAEQSIDDAFKRRIRFKIEFPFPDPEQRGELWRVMIPGSAETEGDLDFEDLGESFEMSGGSIKNAVIRAAFIAASREKAIGFEELWLAARREYAELGHLIRDDNYL